MKYIATLLFAFICITTFGQSTWRKGIITKTDGTTVEGHINDLEWNTAHKEIEFRKDEQAIEKYSVDDILHFATDRPVRYESHSIIYDGDTQDLKNLPVAREPQNLVNDKVFLEVKVNGRIGLLYMQDKNRRQHYFLKFDTIVTELLNRHYQNPAGHATMLTNARYKQQLAIAAANCADVQRALNVVRYSRNSLSSVVTKLNTCRNDAVKPIWQGALAERKRSNMGISIQGYATKVGYLNFYNSPLGNLNYGVGVFGEFYSKRKPNRISFYNEVLYKTVSAQPGIIEYNNRSAAFECSKIRLINAIRFSFPHKRSGRFYMGIGLDNGYRMNTLIGERARDNFIGHDFESGFEMGMMGMIGETFVLFKSFKINTDLRYSIEYDPSRSCSFSNIGLNLQFNLK